MVVVSVPSVETRRKAMEQIRYADRLVGGALGTFQALGRGNLLEMAGSDLQGGDGFFGEHDRRDNLAAVQDVAEAEGAFRNALELLGRKPEDDPETFAKLGLVDGSVTRILDILQFMQARRNASRAEELHRTFVSVFEALRTSDPALASEAPLADWKEDLLDVAKVQLAYSPGVRFNVATKVIGAVIGVIVMIVGYFVGDDDDRPTPFSFMRDDEPEEPSVAAAVERELSESDGVPAPLFCHGRSDCPTECLGKMECRLYESDLDGVPHEEWILVGRDLDETLVEVFRVEQSRAVRIGAPFELGAEHLPGGKTLARRSAGGLQPLCLKTFVEEGAPTGLRCFEFDGKWTPTP